MKSFFKYLSQTSAHDNWGVNIISSGYHQVRAGESYPPPGHPNSHQINWDKGRTVSGYYLVYIPSGSGFFETSEQTFNMNAGDMLLLYHKEWHRYKPNAGDGWEEYWIGFEGPFFDEPIKKEVFPDDKSYLKHIGYQEEIIYLMNQALEVIRRNTNGYKKLLAGILIQLLAYTIALEVKDKISLEESVATKAIKIIHSQLHQEINFEEYAKRLNLSYSRFRVIFKNQTGLAPQQYLIEERVKSAHRLLTNTDKAIKEIAALTGFQSVFYFSRLFKQKTGLAPSEVRRSNWKGM